jgi:hypothetical protein
MIVCSWYIFFLLFDLFIFSYFMSIYMYIFLGKAVKTSDVSSLGHFFLS